MIFAYDSLDITTAYLNGIVEEEIFMEKPKLLKESLKNIILRRGNQSIIGKRAIKMLKDLESGDTVCKLQKAIYGLKQSGNQWNKKLNEILNRLQMKSNDADPCVYYLHLEEDILFIVVYVDDILVAYRKKAHLDNLVSGLSQELDVRDLGEVKYCLGFEVTRTNDSITIS